MSKFDFPNAKPVELLPLESSFEENDIEGQIKAMALALWDDELAEYSFDVNVMGMAHLGTFDLVRRSVNRDGLALLQGDREEATTRYLYRAWKSRDRHGRGLYFLRTYLQMLFPNACRVDQMWQRKDLPYPEDLMTAEQVKERGHEGNVFLTSRVHIEIDFSAQPHRFPNLMSILSAVIPARFVPEISRMVASVQAQLIKRTYTRQIYTSHLYPLMESVMQPEPIKVFKSAVMQATQEIRIYPL